MPGRLREQVRSMEAVCHRLLRGTEDDPLTRQDLTRALAAFIPEISTESMLIRGYSNVVHGQARMLLDYLKDNDLENVEASIKRLCKSVASLREVIDLAFPPEP